MARSIEWRARCGMRIEVFLQSQLVVVHLGGLQQTANLHRTLSFVLFGLGGLLLTFLGKELGIVTRELLQRDQEVSQDDLELGEVRVGGEESIDERGNLTAAWVSNVSKTG